MSKPGNSRKPIVAAAHPFWCLAAAFGTYFCMYGYRKAFTAADFPGHVLGNTSFKVLLVTAQVLGYTVSKFVGIRVIAEMEPQKRAGMIVALIGVAELALLLFAITPAPYNAAWLFVNGLPLGMVFGLVLGFLEGRRQTEILTAGLCASFIVADGAVKSTGARLLTAGVPPVWMPCAAGALFAPPFLLFVWMLSRIPPPERRDREARSERAPMKHEDRRRFLEKHGFGLFLISVVYLLVTILRSVRADFAPEIWAGLQATVSPDVYGWSETIVGVAILPIVGSLVLVRDNRRAFGGGLALAVGGTVLIALSLLGLAARWLSPFAFMVLIGLGLYLPYLVVHATLFERLIAMTRDRGNIGYLMYLVDAFGYLGYVVVLLARNFLGGPGRFLPFFTMLSWMVAALSLVALLPCWRFFLRPPSSPESAAIGEPAPATGVAG